MRLTMAEVEAVMAGRAPGTRLADALGVAEVFASGALADEVYVLEDVGGKRIAIAPRRVTERYGAGAPGGASVSR